MIQYLNQRSFHGFGTVASERTNAEKQQISGGKQTMHLEAGVAHIFRAVEDTWLCNGTGMTVLSASADNEKYSHFYLDKPVCVKAGVWFSLAAFREEASAEIFAHRQPELLRTKDAPSLRVSRQRIVDGLYTFFYQEKEQGFVFPGESHSMPELIYVDRGTMHSVADGRDLLLEQGDIVIYGPNQWHMQYADIGVAPRFVTISFDLAGVDLAPLVNRKFVAPQQAMQLLQMMLREQERGDEFSGDMIISELTLLLVVLLRQTKEPKDSKLQIPSAVHNENQIVRKAQMFISTHIREKLSVPVVAQHVDVSPSYLTALFHKSLQISPGEYIRRIKLQESKQMIRENEMNFTEIAAALQYSTVHHFSRQFKEKFGITPTEYAKSVR